MVPLFFAYDMFINPQGIESDFFFARSFQGEDHVPPPATV